MKIELNNIGIIKNSSMSLEGLTIITGKNNSGKTTVGKALYSLLDAVSNISNKARNDREQYIVSCLDDVLETLDLLGFFVRAFDFEDENEIENHLSTFPTLKLLLSGDYRHEISQKEVEIFSRNLQTELSNINIDEFSKINVIKHYVQHFSKGEKGNNAAKVLSEQITKAKIILSDLFLALEKDPQLIDYIRESINQTLNVEFSGQIQPASFDVESSSIKLYDNNTCCFKIDIKNNKVVNDGNPVFFTSPYKKVFLVDSPFLLDEPVFLKRYLKNPIDTDSDCLLNPHNITSHTLKLRRELRAHNRPSVLEQTILNESLEKIKREIDSVIPGSFVFSPNGDFYVQKGKKLKYSNLATGSKMFSIIKLLLEKGELGNSTMLILDEPEAHLHPSWQNRFAEMIVLLVKELGVNILLTTHSSNFVLALDAYMRKHAIEEKTNFYRTEFTVDGMVDYVSANDDIGVIYQDFLQYLSEVKMLRNHCIKNTGDES